MGAHIWAEGMPAVLHFHKVDVETARSKVIKWAHERVITNLGGAMNQGENRVDAVDGALINWAAMPVIWVRDSPPPGGGPGVILEIEKSDL